MVRIVHPVISFYDQVDGDIIYDQEEEFVCSKCGIKHRHEKWDIPKNIIATEKQISTCEFISKTLDKDMPVPIKKHMWQFIHDNIEIAIEKSKKTQECMDEIDMDLYSEYFFEEF